MRFVPTFILPAALVGLALAGAARAQEAPTAVRSAAVLQAAIDAAEPGAVLRPEAGVYEGHLRIRTALTLDGRGVVVIDGGGTGTVVQVLSPDVVLRGLVVRGSGENVTGEPAGIRAETGPVVVERCVIEDTLFGIDLREAPGSIIRGNRVIGKDLDSGRRGDGIRLWWSHRCVVEDNTVERSRDMVFWYSEGLDIRGNLVTGSRYGLHFMYSHDTTLTGNELSGNSVGVYLMYSNSIRLVHNRMSNNRGASGYGIGLKDCDDIVIERNALLSNRVGVYIDNSPSSEDSTGLFEANLIAFNEIGLLATPNTHSNVFTGNGMIENEQQAATHGRGHLTLNAYSREGVGNFWSDYAGFDRDGDGRGDLPYAPRSLFGAMLAREPNLRLFVHSPAQQAIDFTARALPELRPEPTLVDEFPLTRPPRIDIPGPGGHVRGGAMAGLAGGLLALAACFWLAFGREPAWISRTKEGTP